MNNHPQDMAVPPAQPQPKPPQCKVAGIIVLVFGILEFILMIAVQVLLGVASASGEIHGIYEPYWWGPLLYATGLIVTGSLALASSLGRPCHVATVVVTSITLAWACIRIIIYYVLRLVRLMIATSAMEQNGFASFEQARYMAIVWAIVLLGFGLGLMVFVCLIVILVRVSRLVCCRPQEHDQLGLVVREVPPAVMVVTHPPPAYTNQI